MKHFYSFVLFLPLLIFSQNGPGGVGTSANNIMWLDANRGLTLAGSNVTSWADQSGNGFNAVPSSTAARPLRVAAAVNGYPALDFDGVNDELWINDNATLDLTQWHFFIVPIVDFAKNYNAWLTKGDDSQENYEMLSFDDGNMHSPIYFTDGVRTFSSSAGGQVTITDFNILEYSYSPAVGRDVYKNFTSITTDNETRTPAVNNFSVYIGNEKTTTGRFADGKLAEIIMYNTPLNSAQRIIVNNYLAAKYNRTLSSNDLYTMDNAVNGNYDHDVAGIGRIDVSNTHLDSKGSGVIRVLNATGLGDGEFYFWGHDNGGLGSFFTNDYPTGLQGRLVRTWRGSEIGTINSFDVRVDLAGLGTVTASQLRLLVDVNNDGSFVDETIGGGGIVSGASLVSGSIYQFAGVTGLNNGTRFTIGTTNITSTPLPITLIDFNAVYNNDKTDLSWSTASEKNNNYFTIERSGDGLSFEAIATVKAAGNSSSRLNYSATDKAPYPGLSYYRLKQTDVDGTFSYSDIIAVNASLLNETFPVFPNPNEGLFTIDLSLFSNEDVFIEITDEKGKSCFSKTVAADPKQRFYTIDHEHMINAGVYTLTRSSGSRLYSSKLVIRIP